MAMPVYSAPDHRYASGYITPPWNSWINCSAEMIFDMTSAEVPDIYTSETHMTLLERCV
ncbi:hypothetical protein K503DRAFT_186862 [Rhizopogon vinicolor AM-OR11-026]|uniref:Uncharacterized protein n=1 Tax=Rhizopogon vinicolor AM-OR11-026 TaxID=1314800 RepID=A0A1B7MDN3_9AGAM|nr:hypothetical protein K503DRAFT_186862 [Rhizopogon vinicolor AM-OR11-026]